MLETNNISFIVLSLMLLSFFYYVYSISIKENLIKFIGSALLLSSVSIISSMFIHNGLLSICILGLCLILFKHDRLLECLFISIYFIFLKVLTYVIMTWGINIFINIFIYDLVLPIHDIVYGSDLLLCILLLLTRHLFKDYLMRIKEYTAFYLGIHSVLTLIYLSYLITIFKKGSLPLESSIEIVLITILVMLIYQMVNRILSIEKENYLVKLNNEELKFNKKNYENIITHMNEIRKIKHDMNHMLLSLLEDCEKKDYESLHNHINNQLHRINETQTVDTGNASLNLILASQLSKIKGKNIEFIASQFDDDTPMDKIDFYVLLGNLLDNAIENCTSKSIKKIILDIYKESNDFVIDIKNTSINNPLVDNPNFNTTKEDCGHGFGMRSIMNIVNKYHGEITYDYSYRYFSVQIRIKS
ncbi:GHKL domain-containing protein [uncultured Catenibacterium sp.]|uniref:GHKL domain-containing protein n=1 Tax=uncultured Catenibacterium sp. TaxID=286142 RepID=UPI00260A4311|nr:GHKL domain-containing protein [uncultured Catenibacterium sp.]